MKTFRYTLLAAVALLLAQPGFAQQTKAKPAGKATSKTTLKTAKKPGHGKTGHAMPSGGGTSAYPTPANIAAYTELPNSLLWRVTGKGLSAPSYLFGTFHLQSASFFDKAPRVLALVNETQGVVGEIEMDSAILMRAAALMMVPTKIPLERLITPPEFDAVARKLRQSHQYDITMLRNFSPMLTLQLIAAQDLKAQFPGSTPTGMNDGMDVALQNQARTQRKRVVGLETVEEQMKLLFTDIPLERQAKMLADYVTDSVKSYKETRMMVDAYKEGNLNTLYELMLSSNFNNAESDALLKTRNEAWLTQLPDLMRAYPRLVAVGALHLAGPDGLVYRLKQLGYHVEPVPLAE